MRYDDRLRTVLAQPANLPHDRAVRWRQLVELVARADGSRDSDLFERAVSVIRDDASLVDEQVRMAAARAVAVLSVPYALVRAFAADELRVAAPLLAAAQLTEAEWSKLAADASTECKRFISALHPDVTISEAPSDTQTPAGPVEQEPPPTIREVVARIERLRHARLTDSPPESNATSQARDVPRLFRWESDETGEIAWVDGVPRGAVIGRSIARGDGELDIRVEHAFALRIPFNDAWLELPEGGLAGGRWNITGLPTFEPSTGRFHGYRGIAERPGTGEDGSTFESRDPDSLRELIHELKTPLNAIVGFAEMISGQYLGPAHRPYRDRAHSIAEQARLLLTAIDDLDFAARQKTRGRSSEATDACEVFKKVGTDLASTGARFDVCSPAATILDRAFIERLIARFCLAAVGASREPQHFRLYQNDEFCVVSASTSDLEFNAEPNLGLKLVRALARFGGADLEIAFDRLQLRMPKT